MVILQATGQDVCVEQDATPKGSMTEWVQLQQGPVVHLTYMVQQRGFFKDGFSISPNYGWDN